MKYRAEIDGLRALAVLPVLGFHAGFEAMPGGFIGVDVFFVISGYLITAIIRNEIVNKQFSILNFYERRARRILPALVAVIVASLIPAWVLLTPESLNHFGSSVIASAAFASNIFFWLGEGYFETASEMLPLIHTWSLSVEEQFYLFFPLLLIALSQRSTNFQIKLIFLLVVLSLLISIWATNIHDSKSVSSASFFLLPTRGWELGVGALLALNNLDVSINEGPKTHQQFLAGLGLSLILLSAVFLDRATAFPGIAAIPPVAGAALVLRYGDNRTWVGKFLSIPVLVGVGLISYSLYLWHQPILAFYRHGTGNAEIPFKIAIVLLLLSGFISYLSWRIIEAPFRRKGFLTRNALLIGSALTLVLVGISGLVTSQAVRQPERMLAQKLENNAYVYMHNVNERRFVKARLEHASRPTEALVMGSSRLMQVGSSALNMPTLNLSVSGASIEDIVAVVPTAMHRLDVTTVYIGVDPWLFNSSSGQGRWRSIQNMYQASLETIESPTVGSGNVRQPANLTDVDAENGSFLESVYWRINQSRLTSNSGERETFNKRAQDGSLVYNKLYARRSEQVIENGFPGLLRYSMREYTYSESAEYQLYSLVRHLRERGVQVYFVLSPYHPGLYKLMEEAAHEAIAFEAKMRIFAKENDVTILGSYDPSDAGCRSAQFYDGMHPKESCMIKVFQ